MNSILFSFALLLVTIPLSIKACSPDSTYLGQPPPGRIPEIFAPGIISLDNRFETYPTFSPDGNELYFSVVNASWTRGKILHTRDIDGVWTAVDTAAFSNNNYINWESFISPDGNRQFFTSNRPPSASTDIWVVERVSDSSWSNPVQMNTPVNSGSIDGSACITNNGSIYFKSLRGGGAGGSILYRSPLINGAYSEVENLGDIIPTGPGESEPFMAPDESYLIFISETRTPGMGGWDLWISFRKQDSSWSDPANMGADINTTDDEYGPRVTIDGKYLFFTREKPGSTMDIYWVSSGIIDSLKGLLLSTPPSPIEHNIQIDPNPVLDYLKIHFGTGLYKKANIRMVNLAGKTILSNSFLDPVEVGIDLSWYPKGIYLLVLEVDGEILTKKIVY
ncbi:MAG: T9SS type A sorting domain-containing protein [Bacteroidetes bacterium]|nr:T9SS type A sorting domain-containing protein [Bacteroidota bacterium]